MKPLLLLLALLAAMLAPTGARAQARGPDAGEVQENGQEVLGRRAREQREAEQEANMDEATRALRLQELEAWLRRLPGRYRIKGQVQMFGKSGSVDGIADCSGIGDGPGVDCIINASWPFLELGHNPMNIRPSPAEYLNTMRPSMLVFGLSLDPPRVISQMVMGDSVVLDWSGKLEQDTLNQKADHRCTSRCIYTFNVTAAAQSKLVTFEMSIPGGGITFRMERDPNARAEKPLRALQAK